MFTSLKSLFSSPYNRQHPLFALWRFMHWKCIRIFKRKNVLYSLWDDKRIYLDYDSFQSMWIMYNYIVDWEEFNLVKKIVKQGDTVADVGANMGFYTIWMSKFTNAPASIHSFEPDKKNYERLSKNIAANNLQQVVVANREGAGASEKEVMFTTGLDGENHIASEKSTNTVTVKLITLDKYCAAKNIHHIRYCKIDVEGFEIDVLKGAEKMLAGKKIDILQLEINKTLQNSGNTAENLLEVINSIGYTLCSYDVTNRQLVPIKYTAGRENYFAVADIEAANKSLLL